jgi:hypothetical protein
MSYSIDSLLLKNESRYLYVTWYTYCTKTTQTKHVYKQRNLIKDGTQIFFVRPQIANPQICNEITRKTQIQNRKSANFLGVPIRKSQNLKFSRREA